LTLAGFLLRAATVFLKTRDLFARIVLCGVAGSTVSMITYDILHQTLDTKAAVPVIMLWAIVELIPHWQRTGQIDAEPLTSPTSAGG